MCEISEMIEKRQSTHYGIYHDVRIVLDKMSTHDLLQYFIKEFGDDMLRNYMYEQIIANEINKEKYGGI